MELVLNLAWVLIATSALFWRLRSSSMDRKQLLLALGALCCALLLLFPTISLSDDLHFQAFVTEDSSPSKRLASAVVHTAPVHNVAILWGIFCAVLAALFLSEWFVVAGSSLSYLSALLDRPSLGRAPPVLSFV